MSSYYGTSGSSAGSQALHKYKSIKSDKAITLEGPMEVSGSVKSEGGSVTLNGDFTIRDKLEAYGRIDINGNVNCGGKIKAIGDLEITGYLQAHDQVKGWGELRVSGNFDGMDIEIYGDITVHGYLRCRNLTVYGSITLIGQTSGYYVEGTESVAGPKILRERDTDW